MLLPFPLLLKCNSTQEPAGDKKKKKKDTAWIFYLRWSQPPSQP